MVAIRSRLRLLQTGRSYHLGPLSKINETEVALKEARETIAWLRNQRSGRNATNTCIGDWEKCSCDDCDKRRRLKASGLNFSNYEVYTLTLFQVIDYISNKNKTFSKAKELYEMYKSSMHEKFPEEYVKDFQSFDSLDKKEKDVWIQLSQLNK